MRPNTKVSTARNSTTPMFSASTAGRNCIFAIHPNQAGKMDLTNKPVLGRGFCIKEASSQSYATDCEAIAIIQQICEKEKIAYQKFVNRPDMPGGLDRSLPRFFR